MLLILSFSGFGLDLLLSLLDQLFCSKSLVFMLNLSKMDLGLLQSKLNSNSLSLF